MKSTQAKNITVLFVCMYFEAGEGSNISNRKIPPPLLRAPVLFKDTICPGPI